MAWGTSFNSPETEKDNEILLEAKKRFKICEDWEAQARINFEYDYKFANADSVNMYQWDNWVVGDRQQNNRPCLTINKTQQHNLQVINDGKQNKPGVNIRPVGDEASFEAAQVFQEVVRHIEYISSAENVYDNAATFQVNAGWGYWRVTVEKITGTFNKEIFIRRIKDPRSVYLDPNINEVDGSDAWFGFIFDDMPRDLYEAQHPKFKDVGNSAFNDEYPGWIQRDTVRVCEYFRKLQEDDKLVYFILPETGEEIGPIKWSQLDKDGKDMFNEIKRREGNLPEEERTYREQDELSEQIEWYKIAGNRIIDRNTKWLGKYIPIVRLPGTETVIDGIWDCKGHTRALLDPQRIYNINSPLALNTLIPTPSGWSTMGELKNGDFVFNECGEPVEVIGESPIFLQRKCYRVNFVDGSHIIADEDHLWTVDEKRMNKDKNGNHFNENITLTTKDLNSSHRIWATLPLVTPDVDLPVHPYILGIWLGDGVTVNNKISTCLEDLDEVINNINSCGYRAGNPEISKNSNCASITIHGLREGLRNLGLFGNKHIPSQYLRASVKQRLELLQGLMDTDGHSSIDGKCVFYNSNALVINGVSELVRSLGIRIFIKWFEGRRTTFPNGITSNIQPNCRIKFTANPDTPIFKLSRKLANHSKPRLTHERRTEYHVIKSVEEICSVPVKCISVDTPSHLFLAGEGMIPTHNSANVEFGALQAKAPIVAAQAAVEGFEEYYKNLNTTNPAWVPFNHVDEDGNPVPAPTRMPAPQASPAYVQQMEIAQNEMMMVSGQYQAQMGENENAKSGVAINARQRQGDRATYHFIDNQAIAIRFTGKILIDLIPKVYDTKRVMRIEAKDNTIMNVTIDPEAQQALQRVNNNGSPPTDNQQQIVDLIFNPNVGMYDVQSDTGPSFATRRQEAFNALTQIAAQNKEFMNIAGDILWKVADFPEAQVLAQRWRKIIPPNITGDAPNPKLEQAMHEAADKIEQQLAIIAKQQTELENKDRELTIKERAQTLNETKTAVEEIRQDFKAMSERITALGNSGPAFSAEQIAPLIKQAIIEALQQHGPGADAGEGLPGIHEGGMPIGLPAGNSELPDSLPGVPGSRLAADGKHYVKNGKGWLEVSEAPQENA